MNLTIRSALIAVVALAVMATPAFAQKSQMGLGANQFTKHDLRVSSNTGDLCAACHASHNSNTTYKALLWSHTPSATTGFTYYDATGNATSNPPIAASNLDFKGGTVDITAGSGKVSFLCMSCHDGTIALNNTMTSATDARFRGGAMTGINLLSKDLSNDHPVAFSYTLSRTALPNSYKPTPTLAKLFAGATAGDQRVECASCHDVHSVQQYMLRVPNTNSQLCLDCHI